MSDDEMLYKCSLRINNSLNDPAVLNAVSPYGYTTEKLQTGKALLVESENASQVFDKEYGDVKAAFAKRDNQKDKADDTYNKVFAVSKVALKDNVSAQVALQMTGRRGVRMSKWLSQSKGFYNNLLANQEWLSTMASFGITAEMIAAGLEEIKAVESYGEVILSEKGDAQNATIKRDNKLEELYEWVSDYEDIARVALMDQPQLLEKLGIVVKN